jgi:hypothetical protein
MRLEIGSRQPNISSLKCRSEVNRDGVKTASREGWNGLWRVQSSGKDPHPSHPGADARHRGSVNGAVPSGTTARATGLMRPDRAGVRGLPPLRPARRSSARQGWRMVAPFEPVPCVARRNTGGRVSRTSAQEFALVSAAPRATRRRDRVVSSTGGNTQARILSFGSVDSQMRKDLSRAINASGFVLLRLVSLDAP